MTSVRVEPGYFKKDLVVPTSKSYANRLLILGAICPEPFEIKNISGADDVTNLVTCLKKIGLDIRGDLTIHNSFPECESEDQGILLEPGEGGTTTRFLIGLLARGKNTYRVKLSPEMKVRPMDDLIHNLQELGVNVSKNDDILEIRVPYKLQKDMTVEGSRTTQFASSLALGLADQEVEIIVSNLRNSRSYHQLTNALIKDFKKGKRSFKVPLDFSSLSYPFALGLINGEVEIKDFSFDPLQADSKLLDIFKDSFTVSNDILKVVRNDNLKPLDIDCSDCLDLVPTLAFICSNIPGKSILRNLEGLLFKETNRIKGIMSLLDLFGVTHKLSSDYSLEIRGNSNKIEYSEYKSPQDHRLAMTAYLFMKNNKGGEISNASCVKKSFPEFFTVMS